MSLKAFHIVFISLSALLGGLLTAWGFRDYLRQGDWISLGMGGLGALIFIALVPYGFWFWRKMKKLALVGGLVFFGFPGLAEACAVCFGDPDSPLSRGALWGVVMLGAVVWTLLLAMIGVSIRWHRRGKRLG